MFPAIPRPGLVLCLAALGHARNESIDDPSRCTRLPQEHVRMCLEQICSHGRFDFEVVRLTQDGAVIRPFADSTPTASCSQHSVRTGADGTGVPPYSREILEQKRASFQTARNSALILGGASLSTALLGVTYALFTTGQAVGETLNYRNDSLHISSGSIERGNRTAREGDEVAKKILLGSGVLMGIGMVRGIQALIRHSDLHDAERRLDPQVEFAPAMSPDRSAFAMILRF